MENYVEQDGCWNCVHCADRDGYYGLRSCRRGVVLAALTEVEHVEALEALPKVRHHGICDHHCADESVSPEVFDQSPYGVL